MLKQKIIILHGWNGSLESWKKFIKLAEKKYEINFVTLPCFDGIDCPVTVWDIQKYADYVFDKINKINKQSNVEIKPILLAHSFGGQIAAVLVAQHPKLISRLVFSGPAIIRPKKSIKKILLSPMVLISRVLRSNRFTKETTLKIRKIIYKLIGGHDYIEASGIKAEIFKKITAEDVSKFAQRINIPTTILWGTNDSYTPLWQGHKLAKLIVNSKLHIKKNGRHGLHITHPKWILDKINLQ